MRVKKSITIDTTPEEIFKFVADVDGDHEWDSGLISIEKLTDGPMGLGKHSLCCIGIQHESTTVLNGLLTSVVEDLVSASCHIRKAIYGRH